MSASRFEPETRNIIDTGQASEPGKKEGVDPIAGPRKAARYEREVTESEGATSSEQRVGVFFDPLRYFVRAYESSTEAEAKVRSL